MKIRFSRHAKRRAKLYRISESAVMGILSCADLSSGKHELLRDIKGMEYRLKIVVVVEADIMTVITNYPLKKGRRP